MKVLFLTKYGTKGASSRVRSYQYIPYLTENGVSVTVSTLFDNGYLDRLYEKGRVSAARIAQYYLRRLDSLLRGDRFDVVWIEKELFPWVPFCFERTLLARLKPFVVDFDDAIFHHYDSHHLAIIRKLLGCKIDMVMKEAAMVVAGNDYLAARARAAGALRTEIIPTVVDLTRYPSGACPKNDIFTVGWIGSPSTRKYLDMIGPALAGLCRGGRARLVLVGSGNITLQGIPLEVRPWSEETEVSNIREFDAGIMPLPDGLWERGKCGYKLIQYMACGKPVVGSPVGVNRELIVDGVNGFSATTVEGWGAALARLRDDREAGKAMGKRGRELVEKTYCLQVTAPRLAQLLHEVASIGGRRW